MNKAKLGACAFCTAMVAAAMFAGAANATVVTSLSGTTYSFGSSNYEGQGPIAVAPGVTWSSNNTNHGGAVYGWTQPYGYAGNGYWDGALGGMAGLNDAASVSGVTDSMTFAFSTPVKGVGGFLNWYPDGGDYTTIAVYDAADRLIESYQLTFATGAGVDKGEFLGFEEPTADISTFVLTNGEIGIVDLTTSAGSTTGVPEPLTLSLFGAAVAGAAAMRRRRKANKAA